MPGTCEWFTTHGKFHKWHQSSPDDPAGLLWVSADPGCGKSVLTRYLVDDLLLNDNTRTVCYFFFKDDFPDQRSAAGALAALFDGAKVRREPCVAQVEHPARIAARLPVPSRGHAGFQTSRDRVRIGFVADDSYDAAQRPRAVERALRPLQHLHRRDIVETEVRVGRVVGQANVAEILADGRLGRAGEARIGDAADKQLVAPIA